MVKRSTRDVNTSLIIGNARRGTTTRRGTSLGTPSNGMRLRGGRVIPRPAAPKAPAKKAKAPAKKDNARWAKAVNKASKNRALAQVLARRGVTPAPPSTATALPSRRSARQAGKKAPETPALPDRRRAGTPAKKAAGNGKPKAMPPTVGPVKLTLYVGGRVRDLYFGSRSRGPGSEPGARELVPHANAFRERCIVYDPKTGAQLSNGLQVGYLEHEFKTGTTPGQFAIVATRRSAERGGGDVPIGYVKGGMYAVYGKTGVVRTCKIDILCTEGRNKTGGTATLIMDALESYARAAGARLMTLYSVDKPATYSFYKRLGYSRSSNACAAPTRMNREAAARYASLVRDSAGGLRFRTERGRLLPAAGPDYVAAMEGKFFRRPDEKLLKDQDVNWWNDTVLMTKCIQNPVPGDGSIDWSQVYEAGDSPFLRRGNTDLGSYNGKPWQRVK